MDITVSDIFDKAGRLEEERAKKLVPLAKDVVMVLVKTIKATRMYLPNNPVYQKFYDELLERLQAFFNEEEALSLLVDRFELTFMGRQVYHNPDKDDNLAMMFFKDGIKEFCFHKGITPEEAHGFIDMMKTDARDMGLDDDLVTLLWERGFRKITYTVTDEATEEEAREEEAFLAFEDGPQAPCGFDGPGIPEPGFSGERGPGLLTDGGGGIGFPGDTASFAQDFETIRGSFNAPDELSLLSELADIFYEILVTEKEKELFGMVADSLTRSLEIFVKRGDVALATILVMKVQELYARPDIMGNEEKLRQFLEKAGSTELVGMVGEFIDQGGPEAVESAGSYLMQLDAGAVKNIAALFESLHSRKARKSVVDILARSCAGNGRAITEFLRHRHWFVARNIAIVLGRVADAETVPSLGAALKHEDPRVRREAINSLAAINTGKAQGYMADAIADPDRNNRALAARLLTETVPKMAYERLLLIVSDKKFVDKEPAEMREVFELLGRAGRDNAVDILAKWFQIRGFIVGKLYEKSTVCAAYGLAAAGGDEAERLLKAGTGSKSKTVQNACIDALKQMSRAEG